MYSNSKEQVSLEEAYRRVHLEEKEETECDCDCEDAKNGCDCGECEGCFKNSAKGEKKEQVKESLVDVGTAIVQSESPSQVVSDLARWAFAIGGAIATGTLFANQNKAAEYISELMHIPKFNQTVKEIEQDLKSDDIQKLKDAHNKKVRLLRVLDNTVIKKAVEMGLLKDPNKAYEALDRDVDIVSQEAAKIERM
jgi:negative regulator of replication initiation